MARFISRRGRAILTNLGVALSIALLVIVFTQEFLFEFPPLKRAELSLVDLRFQKRGPLPMNANSSKIVIVAITQESFRTLPDPWPWPKEYYTRLVRNLKKAGAKAIGIDLIFSSSDPAHTAAEEELRAELARTPQAVLAGKLEPSAGRYRILRAEENYGNIFTGAAEHLGLVNVVTDVDGVLRRYMPFAYDPSARKRIPTFSMAMLNASLGMQPGLTAGVGDGAFGYADLPIPGYDSISFLINWYGPSGTFRRLNIADVLDDSGFTTTEERANPGLEINTFDDPEMGYLYDGTFTGKIVLVGTVMPEDKDLFTVPVGEGRIDGDNQMYGVEIHANVIQSVLDGNFLTRQPRWQVSMIVIGLCLFSFSLTAGIKAIRTKYGVIIEILGAGVLIGELMIIYWLGLKLFNEHNLVVDMTAPFLAVIASYVGSSIYNYVSERRQKLMIKNMFTQYVNPAVVDELLEDPEKLRLGGERKELTVFFSDIEQFTSISETMPPEELVTILNEYLNVMTSLIFSNNGTLDKYEGDAIMAFWGAPLPQADHAFLACRTAVLMQESIDGLSELWRAEGRPVLRTRIGINTAEVIVGNLGGVNRFDYTAIGDGVNLGSRLENVNKEYRTRTIISEYTYSRVAGRVIARELDFLVVAGKTQPIRVYELIGIRGESAEPAGLAEFLGLWDEGIMLHRKREWAAAIAKFEAALKIRPDDYPASMYVTRCIAYRENPPPPAWMGEFVMLKK
ncbi:MAG TPA: adenylate/guanylate cyclase domain-containing protein [Bacteroidota bacterium]|nr:adenylate/guanylate cyclase domain-containing protein [Bacteroidota bacterium]